MNHLSFICIFESYKNKKPFLAKSNCQATIGSRIKLLDKKTLTYSRITLTEAHDHAPNFGRISYLSSLGSELLGAVSGEHINIKTDNDVIEFQVLNIINSPLLQGGNH